MVEIPGKYYLNPELITFITSLASLEEEDTIWGSSGQMVPGDFGLLGTPSLKEKAKTNFEYISRT